VEGYSLAIAKSIDDRDSNTILPARAVTDIDDKAVETIEVSGNRVQSGFQVRPFNAVQFENADVANGTRTAIVKHPGLAFFGPTEAIVDQSVFGRFEELPDIRLGKLLPEPRLSLRIEISFLATQFGFQLDMSVVQRGEHPADNIEELVVTRLTGYFWPVGFILLVPIDIPQFKKRISLVKGLP
jgi:hypothetical protein